MVDVPLQVTATGDTAQAQASVDALKERIQGVAAAQTEGAAAAADNAAAQDSLTLAEYREEAVLKEHGARLAELTDAQKNAAAAMREMADTAAVGGAKYAAAIEVARSAVARLEIAQEAIRVQGGPVSPQAIAQLAAYDGAVQAASASTVKATGAHREFGIEAGLMRGNVMGLARALSSEAQETESLAGSFARLALPIGAAVGVSMLFSKALQALKDRGVEVGTASSALEKITDALAVALGGTTLAAENAAKGFRAEQDAIKDLDETTRLYQTGADLLAAVQADAAKTTEMFGLAATNTASDLLGLAHSSEAARGTGEVALHAFNQGLNDIALTSPATATKFRAALKDIADSATQDSGAAVVALQKLIAEEESQAAQSRKVIGQIQDDYGKTGVAAFGKFVAAADDVEKKFDKLTASGFTSEQAYARLKGEFNAVALAMEKFGGHLDGLDPKIASSGNLAVLLSKTYSDTAVAIEKVGTATDKAKRSFDEINDAISQGTKELGNRKTAITAVEKEIDALIASIEKQRDGEGNLNAAQEKELASLRALNAEMGREDDGRTKAQASLLATEKALAKLSDELDKASAAYVKHTEKIDADRIKALQAADAITEKTQKSLALQIAEVQSAHAAMGASDTDYNTKINTLIAQQAKVKQDAAAEEDAINKKAQDEQKDVEKAYSETAEKIIAKRVELNASAETMKKAVEILREAHDKEVEALGEEVKRTGEAKVNIDDHVKSQKAFAQQLKDDTTPAIGNANTALKNHATHHTNLQHPATGIPKTTKHVAELSDQFKDLTTDKIPALDASLDALLLKIQAIGAAAIATGTALDNITGTGAADSGAA